MDAGAILIETFCGGVCSHFPILFICQPLLLGLGKQIHSFIHSVNSCWEHKVTIEISC